VRVLVLAVQSVGLASSLLSPSLASAQSPRPIPSGRVEISVSAADVASSPRIGLAPQASVTFGGSADTSGFEFSQSSGYHVMLPLRGERLLFLDGSQAHVLSESGRLVRTVGRTGSGPGEYRVLSGACVSAADSIRLFDATLQRISVLDPAGTYVRSIDVARTGVLYPGACFRDGRALLLRTDLNAERQLEIALRIVDRDGHLSGELPRQALGAPLPEIFRGRATVFVSGDRIYLALGGKGTITEIRADGTALRVLSLGGLAPRLPESEWWRVLEAMIPRGASATQRTAMRERFGALTRPDSWPAFERVLPDGADGLWVELSHSGSTRDEEWLHFNAAWRLTERVRLPPAAGNGRVIVGFVRSAAFVREFDSDGFVTVSRRALVPLR
jgi:hypothetical protein